MAAKKKRPWQRLRKCSTASIKSAIGYFSDEAHAFDELEDIPAINACLSWMRAELRRRSRR